MVFVYLWKLQVYDSYKFMTIASLVPTANGILHVYVMLLVYDSYKFMTPIYQFTSLQVYIPVYQFTSLHTSYKFTYQFANLQILNCQIFMTVLNTQNKFYLLK